MPELPEVEAVVRSIAPHAEGRRITSLEFFSPLAAGGDPDTISQAAQGQRIHKIVRRGKHILFHLDNGLLDVHLRMTGRFLRHGQRGPYTRALLQLDREWFCFDDTRQFGRFVWRQDVPQLGPDALEITAAQLVETVQARRGRIKSLLLNQTILSGLGNIYVDEVLFRTRVHPLAIGARLSRPRLLNMHAMIREVLTEALELGGSSISNYVNGEGESGSFQTRHRVYGRKGEACLVCGSPIRRIVVGQRGTYFCSRCQRR